MLWIVDVTVSWVIVVRTVSEVGIDVSRVTPVKMLSEEVGMFDSRVTPVRMLSVVSAPPS